MVSKNGATQEFLSLLKLIASRAMRSFWVIVFFDLRVHFKHVISISQNRSLLSLFVDKRHT